MFDRDIAQCMQRKWEAGMSWIGALMLFMCIHSQGIVKVHCNKVLYVGDANSKLYS